jgi:hypothetical protein
VPWHRIPNASLVDPFEALDVVEVEVARVAVVPWLPVLLLSSLFCSSSGSSKRGALPGSVVTIDSFFKGLPETKIGSWSSPNQISKSLWYWWYDAMN